MLEQLQKDWKAAISSSSRRLIRQEVIEVNGQKVVKSQKVLFQFRGIDAFMELDLFKGDENLPPEKRRYRNIVNVPSTNKQLIVYPHEWESEVKKMMAILIVFHKGREHEDRVAIRRQEAIMRENENIVAEFRSELDKTSFTKDEKDMLIHWMDEHSNSRKMSWNKVLLDVLTKYHNFITGRGLIEVGINLGAEANRHVRRCYDTCAKIISASMHQNGKRFVSRLIANILFLEVKDVPMTIYVVRSLFAKVWDRCFEDANADNSMLFAYICDCIGAYYAFITGIPVDKHCADIQKRYIEYKNREASRRINGDSRKKFREQPQAPIVTFEDEYSDVLDKAASKIAEREQNRRKKHERLFEDDDEGELEEKPKEKKKIQPAVITVETQESIQEEEPEYTETEAEEDGNLATMQEAFEKADLL